ncbi:MAG: Ig-like domain-containing protein [Candidatus Zixiibacteriota bacterium]
MTHGRLASYGTGIALVALVALVISCAQVAGPSGGEPDKTAPRLISSQPANGAVEVATHSTQIRILFSEPVQEGVGRQVFISPRPAKDPKLSWHGDQLTISLSDTLRSNQTYVLQVSSAVTDLRNNRLDSAVIVAFSTGQTLDSGRIGGTVTALGAASAGALVGLYPVSAPFDSLRYDSIPPAYMALGNGKGKFEFRNLPKRPFQLIAWLDRNRDEKFNPLTESYAVTDRPLDLTGAGDFSDLSLAVRAVDTARPEVLSAAYTSEHLLRIRIGKPIRTDQLASNLERIRIAPLTDTSRHIYPTGLLERNDSLTSTLTCSVPPLSDSAYSLNIAYDSLLRPMEMASFVAKGGTDKESPSVVSFQPAGQRPVFAEDVQLRLVVSEPLDTIRMKEGWITFNRVPGSVEIPMQRQWRDPFHFDITTQPLPAGSQFELRIADSSLYDLAGNKCADSTLIFKFATINPDSLGSVSGTISVDYAERAKAPLVLKFHEVGGKYDLVRTFARRQFDVSLPAGKYLLSGYLDSNGNHIRDLGSVWPYLPAETGAISMDTITVRARFETTGIEFKVK